MAGDLHRLVWVGIRCFRCDPLQFRGAELCTGIARPRAWLGRCALGDFSLDRHHHGDPAYRLGHRWISVRPGCGPHRAQTDSFDHDPDLQRGQRALRAVAGHLAARRISRHCQPRHRWRMGGGRGAGSGSRARLATRRGRLDSLHCLTARFRFGWLSQLPDRRRVARDLAGNLMAIRASVRPDTRRARDPGALVPARIGALATGREA